MAVPQELRPKEDDDDDSHRRDSDGTRGGDKNPWMNFKGEKRKNDTRTTKPALFRAMPVSCCRSGTPDRARTYNLRLRSAENGNNLERSETV